MALGNCMERVHQGVYISEMETGEWHSWHHMCAELQEMAMCGERNGKKEEKAQEDAD